MISPLHPQFKARVDFIFSLRSRTSSSQKFLSDLEERKIGFHDFIRKQRDSYEFEDNVIINMNKLFYFNIVPGETVDQGGTKSVGF